MKIKALKIYASFGVVLISNSVIAGSGHHHSGHYHSKHHHPTTHTHTLLPPIQEADNWHQHPANPFTKDTLHNHPNGLNHHVHTYGTGVKKPHVHHGFTYLICPYPGH